MMKDNFLFIAFTCPDCVADEASQLVELLGIGFDYVHIRKPAFNSEEVEMLVNAIPEIYHPRLRLHDAFELSQRYHLGGIHINSRHSDTYMNIPKTKSCHSIVEVESCVGKGYDYVTLSPIFDSISKRGYKSNFSDLSELRQATGLMPVVALGGVDASNVSLLQEAGFAGAAFLGALWENDKSRESVEQLIKDYKNNI